MASLEKRAKDSRQQVGRNFLPSLVLSLGISSEKLYASAVSLKYDEFLPGHFRAQQITQCALWLTNLSVIIIIIGMPVAPNYKIGFLCRKKPEKPEKSVIIIYTSQNITRILKPLHCTIGSLMNPLYGGLVQILKTSTVHCNCNY